MHSEDTYVRVRAQLLTAVLTVVDLEASQPIRAAAAELDNTMRLQTGHQVLSHPKLRSRYGLTERQARDINARARAFVEAMFAVVLNLRILTQRDTLPIWVRKAEGLTEREARVDLEVGCTKPTGATSGLSGLSHNRRPGNTGAREVSHKTPRSQAGPGRVPGARPPRARGSFHSNRGSREISVNAPGGASMHSVGSTSGCRASGGGVGRRAASERARPGISAGRRAELSRYRQAFEWDRLQGMPGVRGDVEGGYDTGQVWEDFMVENPSISPLRGYEAAIWWAAHVKSTSYWERWGDRWRPCRALKGWLKREKWTGPSRRRIWVQDAGCFLSPAEYAVSFGSDVL